jgi:hypothetical protein
VRLNIAARLADIIIVNLIERDVYAVDLRPIIVPLLKEHVTFHAT